MLRLLLLIPFFSLSAQASTYESYDEIVDKLSKYEDVNDVRRSTATSDFRSFSRAHVGIGVGQSVFDADAPGLDSRVQNQSGMLINIGVDLLNSTWGLEGTFANFGTQSQSNTQIKLREYNLKGLYKPSISNRWNMRLGLGVSSRFLDVSNDSGNQSFRTPSGLMLVGLESYINSWFSIGADFSFRTAMIKDTIDKTSADFAVRIDTHF